MLRGESLFKTFESSSFELFPAPIDRPSTATKSASSGFPPSWSVSSVVAFSFFLPLDSFSSIFFFLVSAFREVISFAFPPFSEPSSLSFSSLPSCLIGGSFCLPFASNFFPFSISFIFPPTFRPRFVSLGRVVSLRNVDLGRTMTSLITSTSSSELWEDELPKLELS